MLVPIIMKKGRPGTRIEALTTVEVASRVEEELLRRTTTLGVRRTTVERRALRREVRTVRVLDQDIRVKIATLPDGSRRLKPEFDDVREVAASSGRLPQEVSALAVAAAERD